jgi:hypothetical protein
LILRMMSKAPESRPSLREIRTVLDATRDPSAAPSFDEVTADDPITRITSADLRLPPAITRPPRFRLTGRLLGSAIAVAVVAVSAFGLIALRAQPAASITVRPRKPAANLPPIPTAVESLPQPGTVAVAVDVPNARIVVDGKLVGESVTYARVLVERPGRHEIEVSAPGKRTFRTSVEVGEGATVEVEADLDARVASERPARKTARARPAKAAPATGDQLILDPYRRKP